MHASVCCYSIRTYNLIIHFTSFFTQVKLKQQLTVDYNSRLGIMGSSSSTLSCVFNADHGDMRISVVTIGLNESSRYSADVERRLSTKFKFIVCRFPYDISFYICTTPGMKST